VLCGFMLCLRGVSSGGPLSNHRSFFCPDMITSRHQVSLTSKNNAATQNSSVPLDQPFSLVSEVSGLAPANGSISKG